MVGPRLRLMGAWCADISSRFCHSARGNDCNPKQHMFDTIDAALYYPSNGHVYFFKGPSYIKYRPGHGVVVLSGRVVRSIGTDGWQTFPPEFHGGVDAALFYPPNGHAYFFKGSTYLKYNPSNGVVPLADGRVIRTVGRDGWQTFPAPFAQGVNAALFYPENDHAYFFKGTEYIKYRPGSGVVPIGNRAIRSIGVDGWTSLSTQFREGIDAATEYPPRGKVYFFRGRDYLRWQPGEGVDPRYPRRIGLLHRDHGGWPGLSHVVAGPLLGPVSPDKATIWVWLTDAAAANALQIEVNGAIAPFTQRDPITADLVGAIDTVNPASCMRVLELSRLAPQTAYVARLLLNGVELDRVSFTTPPLPNTYRCVTLAFGSCSDMSKNSDVPAFEAIASARPDVALFCGDNCYYVNGTLTTGRTGEPPRDWESSLRMVMRQIEARNHPQFTGLCRTVPCYSTWDDHDFAYNNANGTAQHDDWVGRRAAGAVFRAFWPNSYTRSAADQPIFHSFRHGPVEFFVTDNRFNKAESAGVIWGTSQLTWLLTGMAASTAPVKILVVSGQFLFNRDDQEGHARQAPTERQQVLDNIMGTAVSRPTISGHVLILSGDVHFSELFRLPGTGPTRILEFTSSPLRRDNLDSAPPAEKAPGSRIWAASRNGFGFVTIDLRSVDPRRGTTGTVTLEARDERGQVARAGGRDCRSVWDLGTGAVS